MRSNFADKVDLKNSHVTRISGLDNFAKIQNENNLFSHFEIEGSAFLLQR